MTPAKSMLQAVLAAGFVLAVQTASAALISTDNVANQANAQADRAKVETFMQRADAERALKALGVAPDTAKQRVAALTDEEVHTLATKIDSLPAGAALSSTDIIIILLVAILVVLVI